MQVKLRVCMLIVYMMGCVILFDTVAACGVGWVSACDHMSGNVDPQTFSPLLQGNLPDPNSLKKLCSLFNNFTTCIDEKKLTGCQMPSAWKLKMKWANPFADFLCRDSYQGFVSPNPQYKANVLYVCMVELKRLPKTNVPAVSIRRVTSGECLVYDWSALPHIPRRHFGSLALITSTCFNVAGRAIIDNSDCWPKPAFKSDIHQCMAAFNQTLKDAKSLTRLKGRTWLFRQLCEVMHNRSKCMSGAAKLRCGTVPEQIIHNLMTVILLDTYKLVQGCSVPTLHIITTTSATRDSRTTTPTSDSSITPYSYALYVTAIISCFIILVV